MIRPLSLRHALAVLVALSAGPEVGSALQEPVHRPLRSELPVGEGAAVPAAAAGASSRAAAPSAAACTLIVTGRSAAGAHFSWHEAVLGAAPADGAGAPSALSAAERTPETFTEDPGPDSIALHDRARALLLAGRAADAWELLRDEVPEPPGEAAYLRAWAAARSGAAEASVLLEPFTAGVVPLACRAPALRAAAVARARRGEAALALQLLTELGRALPEIRDHVLVWSLEAWVPQAEAQPWSAPGAARARAQVEVLHRELLALRPLPALLRQAELARARFLRSTGERRRARALLAAQLPRLPRRARPALLLELAQLESALGERSTADGRLRQIVERHADSREALSLLSPQLLHERPRLWLTARDSALVLAAHGRAREAVRSLTPTADPRLLSLRGEIRLRDGDYAAAAGDFREAVARGGDPPTLWLGAAKAHARAAEAGHAREIYQRLLAGASGAGESATLAYLTADAFQEEAAREEAYADSAAAWYRRLADRFPRSPLAARGLIRLAHLRLARGQWAAAEALYREHLRRFPAGEDSRESRYWLARAVLGSGRAGEARALFSALLQTAEPDYYALLARRRLGPAPEAAVQELLGGDAPVSAELAPRAGPPAAADTAIPTGIPGERSLRRARALLALGEEDAAQREIDEALRLSGRSRADLERVARWALAAGFPESAFRIGSGLMAGAATHAGAAVLAFPRAFAEHVRVEAGEHLLAPNLLWAVMRQESRFDPAARSPAGALGLLQLMPATARAEAARAGAATFDLGDLETPEPNLHLGALHLRRLLDELGGNLPAAVAAYNAGRDQAGRWLAFPESATAEGYVERIPFRETRRYVKQVVVNRARYQELYGAD